MHFKVYVCVCMYMCADIYHSTYVRVREQLGVISPFLLPCGLWESNSSLYFAASASPSQATTHSSKW